MKFKIGDTVLIKPEFREDVLSDIESERMDGDLTRKQASELSIATEDGLPFTVSSIEPIDSCVMGYVLKLGTIDLYGVHPEESLCRV